MSMIRHCDKCDRVMTGEVASLGSKMIVDRIEYDLCKDCADLFMRWLNTKPIVEERIVVTSVSKEEKAEKETEEIPFDWDKMHQLLVKLYPVKLVKMTHKNGKKITVDKNKHIRTLCTNGLHLSGFKTINDILAYNPRNYNDPKLCRISTKTFLEIQRLLRKEYPDLCESGTSN